MPLLELASADVAVSSDKSPAQSRTGPSSDHRALRSAHSALRAAPYAYGTKQLGSPSPADEIVGFVVLTPIPQVAPAS